MTEAVLDRAALITTRDRQSKRIVTGLDISTPVYATADAAFSMNTERSRETPLDTLKARDTLPDESETTVSISVREWQHTDGSVDDYAQAVADVADWFLAETDSNVVFASTCTGIAGYHTDDRLMAARVVDTMSRDDSERVQILAGEYTPRQLVDVYDRMDLHIGMRMHSNILPMMAETPVVAIQYQFKTRGLMELFDMVDYMIDIDDVDEGSLKRLVKDAFEERSSLADAVRSKLPVVQQESRRTARLVRDHLGPLADE